MDLLRLPDFNAEDVRGQLQQVKEYITELTQKINYNLWEIDRRLKELENNGDQKL